jgi:hypothetical protein
MMAYISGTNATETLDGTGERDQIYGLGGADTLRGNGGNDLLLGGAGKDTLSGGTGADKFVFGLADATSTDTILDFTAEDWVGIFASDYRLSVGAGLKVDGTGRLVLDPAYFATISGSGNVQGTASGHGQFLYNTTTRTLMWDADGAGTGSSGIAIAAFNSGVVLSAADFAIMPKPVVGNISISDVTITEGNSGTKTATFTVSRTGTAAFSVDFAIANGTATAGTDYVAKSGTLSFALGQAKQTVAVTINGDKSFESNETFFVKLANATNGGNLVDSQGLGTISNDDKVLHIHNTTRFGSPDPSGLAFVPGPEPGLGTLFLSDSEVDESPFFGSKNLFALSTDGTLKPNGATSLLGFSKEPTGLAFNPVTGHLLVSDDRSYKVFWVDPANPTVKLGEFSTKPLGGSDPEDIAVDPVTGHLFICNGSGTTNTPRIIETNSTGTKVFSIIAMPSVIPDSEALAYDAIHDVFYVGGKFSANIWVIDREGTILETINVLAGHPRPGGARVRVSDLELAPSSDPNDGAKRSLYVADYGADQVNDGRLFEIHLGDPLWA